MTMEEYSAFLDSIPCHPSALFFAVRTGNADEVAMILRSYPDLDVNWRNGGQDHSTALMEACCLGDTACVRLLLRDLRVKVTGWSPSPLARAARSGFLDIFNWWIASGREVDMGTPGDFFTDPILAAKNVNFFAVREDGRSTGADIITLLERFKVNPRETRYVTRVELKWHSEPAAEMFALVVFVSDGLLEISQGDSAGSKFMRIASKLPLELQMMLCFRLVGSPKDIIPKEDSEKAFKDLARWI